ncbi:calcium-binding protein [Streptomyces sp. NPDC000345]|uniref:calcium-binding protein n=1 Tax=Streptomyces sp. NPDC000345 TaxID=3364537 RepID=UPI003678E238
MRTSAVAATGTATAALLLSLGATPAQASPTPVITKVVVNKGKNIVVGPSATTSFTSQITASHPAGVSYQFVNLWHGTTYDTYDRAVSYSDVPQCTTSGTATTCTLKHQITPDPREMTNVVSNVQASTWHVFAYAWSKDRTETALYDYATIKVQRASKLTVNASPEPVRKGKTITVTGALTRANWNTHTWAGYSGQSVKLQYRPKNASTYTTVKTLTTSSTGKLSTTVKASADGYYRYVFAGTSTTPAATAAADYVDVT